MHNNYAVITARVLFNKELTSTQKLLIAVISNLSNARGYCFASNQYLGECIGLSKHTVRDAISDLEKKLVLIRVVKLNAQNEVEFRSLRIDADCDFLLQSQVPENSEDPYAVKPSYPPADESSYPLRADPHTPDGRPSHNNKDKNKEENTLLLEQEFVHEKYSFDQFWDMYGKKVGRTKAELAWKKLKPDQKVLAVEKMDNHKTGKERQFWKDPERYLRDRRWEDQPPIVQVPQRSAPRIDPNDKY